MMSATTPATTEPITIHCVLPGTTSVGRTEPVVGVLLLVLPSGLIDAMTVVPAGLIDVGAVLTAGVIDVLVVLPAALDDVLAVLTLGLIDVLSVLTAGLDTTSCT